MARRLLNWFGTVLFLSYSLFLSVPLCARAFACCSFEKKHLMAMGVDNPRRPLSFASPADTGTCRGPLSLPFTSLHSQHYCPVPSPRPQNRDSAVHRFRFPVQYFTRTLRILPFLSYSSHILIALILCCSAPLPLTHTDTSHIEYNSLTHPLTHSLKQQCIVYSTLQYIHHAIRL